MAKKTIEISFPQIVMERKKVEIFEEELDYLMESGSESEQNDFIWRKMTDLEKQHTLGKAWMESITEDYPSPLREY